jgi:hypothetical protein
MSDNIHFTVHTDTESAIFERVMAIYQDSFPDNERQPRNVIQHRVEMGLETLYVVLIGEMVVGFCFLWSFIDIGFDLLDYLAVSSERRGSGYGSFMFIQATKKILQNGRSIVIEAEDPLYGHGATDKYRRIDFYMRNGARILEDFSYILPPLHGTEPTRMRLLFFTEKVGYILGRRELEVLIMRLYTEVYARDMNDPYLLGMLEKIPLYPKLSDHYGKSGVG